MNRIANRATLLLAGTATLALLAWGCGGGGGGSSTSSLNALESGRSGLNNLASGAQPTNEQTLQSILDLFQQAIQQNPDSSEAHFGAAICSAGLVAVAEDNADGGSVSVPTPPSGGGGGSVPQPPSPPSATTKAALNNTSTAGPLPPAPPDHAKPVRPVPPHHVLGLVWNLNEGLSNPYTLLSMLAPLAELRFAPGYYYGEPQGDPARRLQMLSKLNDVVQHLEKVEADPNFSITLPIPDENGQSLTIGLPEVYLFDSYVNSLRVEIALSLAYIRDTGANPPTLPPGPPNWTITGGSGDSGGGQVSTPTGSSFADLDKNHDGQLTPDEYLPPSPFLTLRDPALLQTAQQALLAVADKASKGIDGALARPTDGRFLIPNTPEMRQSLTEIRDKVLPMIRQAATGPVTFEVPLYEPVPLGTVTVASRRAPLRTRKAISAAPDPGVVPAPDPVLPAPTIVKITINLAAWLANPPADLKVFAPTVPLNADGWPQLDKAVYPDPTFGGLLPNGLPHGIALF